MRKYIVGRLLMLIPMLLGASFIIFFMLRLGRGDPALDYLRLSQIPPTDEAIAEARGKTQADSLRKTREETPAKKVLFSMPLGYSHYTTASIPIQFVSYLFYKTLSKY